MKRSKKSSVDNQASTNAPSRPTRVAFLHPNLGIGGAERLIVDFASALQQSGTSTVEIFTNYHDLSHCYPETRDGTLKVTVYGRAADHWLGRFKVLIAILRMIYLTLIFAYRHSRDYDVVVVDQVSHSLPILKWFTSCKILFYCHFPDQLLATRTSMLKRLYRYPFDWSEEWTTGQADRILVNSEFTLETFRATFKHLTHLVDEGKVKVLYPSIDFARYTTLTREDVNRLSPLERKEVQLLNEIVYGSPSSSVQLLTSINRYERKKNIQLAIEAFAQFHQTRSTSRLSAQSSSPSVRLLICGGYDPVNIENQEHYVELVSAASKLNCQVVELKNTVTIDANGRNCVTLEYSSQSPSIDSSRACVYFLRSFTDLQRSWLLSHSLAILYTPTNEHFGIVPIEAMYMRRPVIACCSGGPKESIVDWNSPSARPFATGLLCQPTVDEWCDAVHTLVDGQSANAKSTDSSLATKLGERGHERVLQRFHFKTFQTQAVQHIQQIRQ